MGVAALTPAKLSAALPALDEHGLLPEGIHDSTFAEVEKKFVTNPHRAKLWKQLHSFAEWVRPMNRFSHLYLDGGFITAKSTPQDIDVILQPRANYGTEALESMIPFFSHGMEKITATYSVHLYFWCEGFPGGIHDFRRFFQYVRPQDTIEFQSASTLMKGIVRITL